VSATCLLLVVVGCSSGHPTPAAARGHARPGAVESAGCHAAETPEVTDQRNSLAVAGASRQYLLSTPPAHQLPDPLVVDFHGYGEGDQTESLTTQFGALGQHDGFLAVFPNGHGTPVHWDTSTRASNPDLRFVASLLAHLEATQCIDKARIYATGLSQGAFMTSTVACAMSGSFAAFAPVDGVQLPAYCPAKRPAPILAFHGTADPILHFNGGLGRAVLKDDLTVDPKPLPKLPAARLDGPGYPAHVRAWAKRDGCGATHTDTKLSPHVIQRVYPCPPGTAVEFDIIVGGGHSWPGSRLSQELSRFVGNTTTEINATDAIWTFFQRFHLSTVNH
jgi:polyhydroxybutyrate depolymerase